MRRFLWFFVLLILARSIFAAPVVLTSIQPLQLIASEILGEQGTSEVLLPPGASPHSFTLRPSDSRRFAKADAFFWIGPDMENFLVKLAARRPEHSHAVQHLPGLELLYYNGGGADGHAALQHDGQPAVLRQHDHHHLPGGLDAHLWLSSLNARIIADYMAQVFARLQPDAADHYQANLQAFNQRLDRLDQELGELLLPVRKKPFFVFHEAFNYLERTYGLQHRGVLTLGAEIQPGARHVQQMRLALEQAGASCIFTEPPAPPRLAESLARELPVRLQELDPLGSKADNYAELLRNLAHDMQQCLSGL
ncbi:MAG: zinc ABC transporter solute-binding protein [Gammaproteobacteria bacterium]|nr:zinc ABC transporter solute-binding protein [Gammaproteobacteria bacterium]